MMNNAIREVREHYFFFNCETLLNFIKLLKTISLITLAKMHFGII